VVDVTHASASRLAGEPLAFALLFACNLFGASSARLFGLAVKRSIGQRPRALRPAVFELGAPRRPAAEPLRFGEDFGDVFGDRHGDPLQEPRPSIPSFHTARPPFAS
jgi:hypothetical protein